MSPLWVSGYPGLSALRERSPTHASLWWCWNLQTPSGRAYFRVLAEAIYSADATG